MYIHNSDKNNYLISIFKNILIDGSFVHAGSAENYYEKTNMIVGNIYQNNITSILIVLKKN